MAKSKQAPEEQPESTPGFEESLAELQQIVGDLEGGSLGLEESLKRFESGVGLLRSCYEILERAEQKIEILAGTDSQGEPTTEPFDASATLSETKSAGKRQRKRKAEARDADEPAAADDDDDDSTLF